MFKPAFLILSVIGLALTFFLAGLGPVLSTAAQEGDGPGPVLFRPPLPPEPGQSPPLHYKSRQGLMPAAYTQPPHALSVTGVPDFDLLRPAGRSKVGSWPQVLAVADFTGNKQPDIALATARYFDPANDEKLHLLTGSGGAFSSLQGLPAGDNPAAIMPLDANLDRRADVVLALPDAETLAVYGQLQAGQPLTGPATIALAGGPHALAAGDFNGDLRNDLAAVASQAETIHLWRSSASGLAPLPAPLPYPTGGYDSLAAGDLDNDGEDDLVALRGAGYPTNAVMIYLQDKGAFSETYALTPENGGYLPHGLVVGDVNSDGLDDVVVTAGGNTPDAYLNVFIQTPAGLQTTPVTYPAFHLPSAVRIGDVNHDGRADVLTVHDGWTSLSVYTQTASGTLASYTTAALPYNSFYRSDALAVADLDGNGSLDAGLVGYYDDLTILTNTLTAPTSAISIPAEAAFIPLTPTLTVTGSAGVEAVAVEVRLRGYSDWQPATLTGQTWTAGLALPDEQRAWWIESRAVDAQGVIQAPPARRRIRVGPEPAGVYLPLILRG